MSWGAEDLSAALGASSKYDASGDLSFTYKLARSLCLAGAVAAGVQPVDGVFADFKDEKGLRAEAEAARREGFTGKLAIHPAQVPIINAAFTPSADEVRHAEEIVAAFEAHPDAGVLSVGGKMVDRPHLVQAQARTGASTIGDMIMATTAEPQPHESGTGADHRQGLGHGRAGPAASPDGVRAPRPAPGRCRDQDHLRGDLPLRPPHLPQRLGRHALSGHSRP